MKTIPYDFVEKTLQKAITRVNWFKNEEKQFSTAWLQCEVVLVMLDELRKELLKPNT